MMAYLQNYVRCRGEKMRLRNKVVMLTGAASGIGFEIAKLFAKEGATLIVNDINKYKLKKLEDYFLENNYNYLAVVADISKPSEVKNIVNKAISNFKRIDILVNNGGICMFEKDA